MDNLPTILSEIDSIQEVMRTDRTAYNRNEPMQARYRSLLTQKAGGSSIIEESSEPLLPTASVAEFAAVHGSTAGYDGYLKVMRTAADWVLALPAGEQRSFVATFERLPDDVAAAAIREVLSQYRPAVNPSSDTALAAFAEMPEGAVLMREWGGLAARNLALVRERLFRVVEAISEQSIPAFMDWLSGLSTDCAIAIYRKLAA